LALLKSNNNKRNIKGTRIPPKAGFSCSVVKVHCLKRQNLPLTLLFMSVKRTQIFRGDYLLIEPSYIVDEIVPYGYKLVKRNFKNKLALES